VKRPMGLGIDLFDRRGDGSTFPIDVMLSPLHALGAKFMIAVIRDISDRLYHENQVDVLNKRLSLATQTGEIGVWEWDIVTNTLLWDERLVALYKVQKTDASNQYEMWRQRVHPDDLERAEQEQEAAFSGKKPYATEFRIIWPSGQIRSLQANAIISRDKTGKPLRMTGVNWDVTERKQKEQTLSQTQRSMKRGSASIRQHLNFHLKIIQLLSMAHQVVD